MIAAHHVWMPLTSLKSDRNVVLSWKSRCVVWKAMLFQYFFRGKQPAAPQCSAA